MQIDRREFSDLSLRTSLDLSSADVRSTLQDIGVDPAQVQDIGGADHVIRGRQEFEQLFDRLSNLDRTSPQGGGSLARANRLYDLLTGPRGASADPTATRATGAGAGTGTGAARGVGVSGTRRGPESSALTSLPREVEDRAAELRALPPAAHTPRGPQQAPVSAYLDAITAREAQAGTRGSGAGRPPSGVSGDVWALSHALQLEGITSADVRSYLATGRLADRVDATGRVTETGEARLARLERSATREGSWTAVNSFTSLIGMRRSAMAAERQQAEADLSAMPADAPGRAELQQAIEGSRAADRTLGSGLQTMYGAATHARERTSQALVAGAGRLDGQAETARARGDVARADELDRRARTMRDRSARMASAEATYRAGMPGTGWDASSTFLIAAEAQIGRGQADIAAMRRSGNLTPEVPASLGTDSGEHTGNGVAGAGRLLDSARTANPSRASDHRTLALDSARNGSIAAFHSLHLERGGYMARGTGTASPGTRTPALIAHREGYLEARASQADAIGRRVDLYQAAPRLSTADAVTAAQLESDRRGITGELNGALGQSLMSDRARDAAVRRVGDARTALREADEGSARASDAARRSAGGVAAAEDSRSAVFGSTFKTGGEERRDDAAVADARTTRDTDAAFSAFATRRRDALQTSVTGAERDRDAALSSAALDGQDAQIARRVLSAHPSLGGRSTATVADAYRGTRDAMDRSAERSDALLLRAEAGVPSLRGPARTRALAETGALRLDLGSYYTQSTELNAAALGDAGRTGATRRLDTAATHFDRADTARAALPAGSAERQGLALGLVDGRAALAEANADYRPAVSRDQIARGERLLSPSDVPDAAAAASGGARLGTAATTSLLRQDLRFDEILRSGGHDPTAADGLYAQAHGFLDRVNARDVRDPAQAARVREAQARLGEIDRSLAAVSDILGASSAQLQNGQAYAAANTRVMGRAEIATAQAQVSTVISGGAFLLSFGQFDMKDEMAEAGEGATRMRVDSSRRFTDRQVNGATQISDAWSRARADGRAFEMLGSLRILGDRGNSAAAPGAYQGAVRFMFGQIPGSDRNSDWQDFNRVAIREGQVPVASALRGPVIGLASARDALGDRSIGVVTADMRDLMIDPQRRSLEETGRGATGIILLNTGLEVALGLVLTGGFGSAAAVGEAGNALNAGRTMVQASEAIQTASTLARLGQAANAFRTAYPIVHAMGVATAVGAGMMGVSWAGHRLMGANSSGARGLDVALNFVPMGAGGRAAGIAGAERRAVTVGGAALAHAGEDAGANLGALRRAFSAPSLIAHARFYGPQFALAGAQVTLSQVVAPAVSERLGIRSEAGQAMVGLALNALAIGGTSAIASRRAAGAHTEPLARMIVEGEGAQGGGSSRSARGQIAGVQSELATFLRSTEGHVPTQAEIASARERIAGRIQRQGELPQPVAERLDASLEAVRAQRAAEIGLREAGGDRAGPANEAQVHRAVEIAAERLYQARGGEAGGASRAQAFRDVQATVGAHFETASGGDAALRSAAEDRAAATEITAGFSAAPSEGQSPLLRTARERTQVEAILSSELSNLRGAMEAPSGRPLTEPDASGTSPWARMSERLQREAGLSPTAAESVLRAAQHNLVERGVVERLSTLQGERSTVLAPAEIRDAARDVALRSGMDPVTAATVANEAAASRSVSSWLMTRVSPEAGYARLSPAERQQDYLRRHPQAASLSTLTPQQFQAAFGDGPYSDRLSDLASRQGFAQFAAADPAGARALYVASHMFSLNALLGSPPSFGQGAAQARAWMPAESTRQVQGSGGPTTYRVVENSGGAPYLPALRLGPTRAHDHNGAFMLRGEVPDRFGGSTLAGTAIPDNGVPMRAGQLVVDPRNNVHLTDFRHVAMFSAHGSPRGFEGFTTPQAAAFMADELARYNTGRAPNAQLRYVVLDSCLQGDRGYVFFGETNAQAFQRELNAQLASRGQAPVTVLAARDPGPLYGARHKSVLPFGKRYRDAVFVPAADQPRAISSEAWRNIAIGAGIAGVEGAIIGGIRAYGNRDRDPDPAPDPTPRTPSPRRPGVR